jgi:hypothetical protein
MAVKRGSPVVRGVGVLVVLPAAVLAFASPAGANHSVTELVSTGPASTNGAFQACASAPCVLASRDGSHVFFETEEPLVAEDSDSSDDVYERSAGTTTLVSIGPSGGNGPLDARLVGITPDGSQVYFETYESLVPQDGDDCGTAGCTDVYERFAGTTTLVSTGPTMTNAAALATLDAVSVDGSRVIFSTSESLVAQDTDGGWTDVYERSGGSTTLLSIGSIGGSGGNQAIFKGASLDASHVYFETNESLVSADADSCPQYLNGTCIDVYEHTGGATSLVSTGAVGGNGRAHAQFEYATPDGSHIYFSTGETLASTDLDGNLRDVYDRSGGTSTLVSTGPGDTQSFPACTHLPQGPNPYCPVRASDDGSHVFFFTQESLAPGDTGYTDIYDRSGGTATWVSTGASGGNAPLHVTGALEISKDGTHAFFTTEESLVPEDTDSRPDIYERTGGVTKLVSTGPVDTGGTPDPVLKAISEDGTRAIFESASQLVASDPDGSFIDVFERRADTTTLLSTGPGENGATAGYFEGATPDATHVYFVSGTDLVASDTDGGAADIYQSRVGFEIPQSAPQVQVSLVPAFQQCATGANPANGQHSPPLGTRACLPPKTGSNVAHFGPQATGSAELTAMPGDPVTAADEADVSIQASLTDITATAGGDYNPNPAGADLTLTARLRLTDLASCSGAGCSGPYGGNPATTADLDFPVAVDCASTQNPGVGASCAVTTSADAVMAGAVKESQNTSAQAFRLRLNDSGVNGVRGDSDDRIFSTQGIYVP